MAIPAAFGKSAKHVCDALRWLTAKGKFVHIAGILKILSPYGLLLTASADIQTNSEKITLDHIPLAVVRSPALLYYVQQQPVDIQRLVHQWDPAYRAISNRDVTMLLLKLLKPPEGDMSKVTSSAMRDHLFEPIKEYLPQQQRRAWQEWQKQGHKQVLEHIAALPKLLRAKTSSTLTAEDHHQVSLHVLAWVSDHMALPHLRTLHKAKGHVPLITSENARELIMNLVLLMYAADDLDRINGKSLISWITAPTYTLMIPDNAQPLVRDQINLLSAPSGNLNLSASIEPYSDFYLAQRTLMTSQHFAMSKLQIDQMHCAATSRKFLTDMVHCALLLFSCFFPLLSIDHTPRLDPLLVHLQSRGSFLMRIL